jgi:hypothetical protein
MSDRKLTQRLFDFDNPSPPPTAARVSEDTIAALKQFAAWLTDPRTGRPFTDLGEEALSAVGKALAEGKNGYVHRAEDLLEALALRNGRTSGDDIAPGPAVEDGDFQATLEELLNALAERVTARGPAAIR